MSQLSREQVLKLAALSKLKLSEEEILKYQKELSSILEYVERLDSVNVDGIEPTYQVSGLVNQMREDIVEAQKASADALLSKAPRKSERYIKVGRMI